MAAFEEEFAAYVAAGNAVAVASGMTGLELSLLALRLPRRSRVLVSALATWGAVDAIIRAHLTPVLVDVDGTGRMTEASVSEAARHARADGTRPRALVVDHWAGDPVDVNALADAAGVPSDSGARRGLRGAGRLPVRQPVGGRRLRVVQLLRHDEPPRSARAA